MTYEPQKTHHHPAATDDRRSSAGVAREAVQPFQLKANNTGLPDDLKAGIEGLSGMAMDDVKVHYNSAQPAQLQAHAYAQGTNIHIAPGQERHLPHEAWHVVQQKQGRVAATVQLKAGIGINDDNGLEREADVMGEKAVQMKGLEEEEKVAQMKFAGGERKVMQMKGLPEEEPAVQMKALEEEEKVAQMKFVGGEGKVMQMKGLPEEEPAVQMKGLEEEEKVAQMKFVGGEGKVMQMKGLPEEEPAVQMKEKEDEEVPVQMKALPEEEPGVQMKGMEDEEVPEQQGLTIEEEMTEAEHTIQMKAIPTKGLKEASVPGNAPFQLTGEKEFGYYGRDGKRKSAKTIRMEEFGSLNRVQIVDPDLVSEKLDEDTEKMGIKDEDVNEKSGIWRPSVKEGTARPEDPPLYQPFRKAFHETHNVLLSLKESSDVPKDILKMCSNRLLEIAGEVKNRSLEYKAKLRTFITIVSVNRLRSVYFKELDKQIEQCKYLNEYMIAAYRTASPGFNGFSGFSDNQLVAAKSADGKGIWQKKWWAMVQEVNKILKDRWAFGKPDIKEWVRQQRDDHGISYMDPDMVGELDYIGSLAKGYKSAPKQYIRFLPENFDVDARLDAPPLAVYAIRHGESVDRGSVKPKDGVIPKLDAFRRTVQHYLNQIPGLDKEDEFEVFIRADNVTDLVAENHPDIAAAHKEEAIGRRLQMVQDRIWWLRSKNLKYLAAVQNSLPNYISPDGKLKTRITSGVEGPGTKNYLEQDLTIMEMSVSVVEQMVV